MRISKHTDLNDGSSCTLDFDEAEGWLRAVWVGPVDPNEAYNGAARLLDAMQTWHCPYLLNDNSQLTGPWFDSVEWLQRVWAPQAAKLGLRYIAHIAQPHDLVQQAAALSAQSLSNNIELQLFDTVPEAEEWLREQRPQSVSSNSQ